MLWVALVRSASRSPFLSGCQILSSLRLSAVAISMISERVLPLCSLKSTPSRPKTLLHSPLSACSVNLCTSLIRPSLPA
eukprot:751982-Hanusia_phi.AAC.6